MGRCWLHGGLQPDDKRLTSGRYSTVKLKTLKELIDFYKEDPDPLNLLDELAVMRALTVDFINRTGDAGAKSRKLLAWLEAAGVSDEHRAELEEIVGFSADGAATLDELEPGAILDASNLVDKIGKLVERIDSMRKSGAVSLPELNRVIGAMSRVLEVLIPDVKLKERIHREWLKIVHPNLTKEER